MLRLSCKGGGCVVGGVSSTNLKLPVDAEKTIGDSKRQNSMCGEMQNDMQLVIVVVRFSYLMMYDVSFKTRYVFRFRFSFKRLNI